MSEIYRASKKTLRAINHNIMNPTLKSEPKACSQCGKPVGAMPDGSHTGYSFDGERYTHTSNVCAEFHQQVADKLAALERENEGLRVALTEVGRITKACHPTAFDLQNDIVAILEALITSPQEQQ